MDRRQFITASSLVMTGLFSNNHHTDASTKTHPNFMIVIGDDMTWRDCEPYGSEDIHTPHMAQMAKEGVCFDAMFTATAMCAPTRQQLYTGLYPVRNGAYPNHSWVYEGVKTLPYYLKAIGYRVGLIGKTHFGPPETYPFEYVKGKGEIQGEAFDAIEEFINRDPSQPYCLVVTSHQPHLPWDKGDASQYDPQKLTVPPYLVDCKKTREELARYYTEITYLDSQVGRCMQLVDRSKQKENTMMIFTSEQGAQLPFGKWTCYENGLKTAFIVRWPGVVSPGSRISAMTQYVDVVPTMLEAAGVDPQTIDTGCPDAYGKTGFDGRSFLDVLTGKKDSHRHYVYGAHTTQGIINGSRCYPIRSVRDERYKYILNLNHQEEFSNIATNRKDGILQAWFEKGETDPAAKERAQFYIKRPEKELYDLENDPYELKNLAEMEGYSEIKKRLNEQVQQWMKQQGDQGNETELKAHTRKGGYIRKQRKK